MIETKGINPGTFTTLKTMLEAGNGCEDCLCHPVLSAEFATGSEVSMELLRSQVRSEQIKGIYLIEDYTPKAWLFYQKAENLPGLKLDLDASALVIFCLKSTEGKVSDSNLLALIEALKIQMRYLQIPEIYLYGNPENPCGQQYESAQLKKLGIESMTQDNLWMIS